MRRRILTVGLLAWCFGIANTFAWYGAAKTAFVGIRFLGIPNYVCVNTNLQCNNLGPLTCYVYVLTIYGPMLTAAKDDFSCIWTLGETTNIPVGIYIPLGGVAVGVQ